MCLCVCVSVWVSVWVCVRALAFKGAPSLAHVSMRVRVHLCGDAWSDAAWAHSVWPLTFLQCCRVAVSRVPECQTTPRPPPAASLLSSPPLLTPWALFLDRAQPDSATLHRGRGVWFQIDDAALACMSSEQLRERESQGNVHFYLKKKKKKVLKKTFMGTLLVRERSLVRVAKKQWRTEGEAVWDENSWMYQCFTVSWQPSLLWL